jgi:monofunctional biosynthetic peptidoglycan transglycosylase
LVAAVASAARLPLFSGAVVAAIESRKGKGKVDDSARGDEPSEPNEAGPAVAKPDTTRREPIADAIPTVAPLAPGIPSQIPPWPEETVTADTAGDARAGADVQVGVQDIPEAPEAPIDPEPSPPPMVDPGDDFGSDHTLAVDPAPEVSVEPVVPEPPAPRGDTDVDADDWETDTADPEHRAATEPAVDDLSPIAEDTQPDRVEAEVSDAIVGEPPLVEPFLRLDRPEAESHAAPPTPVDEDIPSTPPSEARPSPGAPQFGVSVADELVWHDPPQALHPAEPIEAEAAAPGVAAPPPDERPVPIHEDQIWSVPEAIEPGVGRVERAQTVAQLEPHAQHHARAEPEPGIEQHTSPSRESTPSSALALPAMPSSFTPPWPSSSLPAPGRTGEAVPYARRAVRIVGGVVLALTATVLLLIVLYRWVDPPASTLMLGQRLTGTEIEQKWVPIERMSPNLIQAVILSEDGGFCRHRGVDWSAMEEAIESSRGGSTITMQVVKNLFLWPARSYVRKALEIMLAYVVEVVWPKERVLEIYLNIAEWGPGVFGAEAAARTHFGKSASQLTAQEAALLAVSLPSPIERQAGYPDQQARRLASNLLLRMRAVRTAQRCVRTRRAGS